MSESAERARCVRVIETMLREIDAEEGRAYQTHDVSYSLHDADVRRRTLYHAIARVETGGIGR